MLIVDWIALVVGMSYGWLIEGDWCREGPLTLPLRFSLLHSDLNDFLFASIGDEPNGMPLSVISALTRLDVDPWREAARLAALPKTRAVEALASMITRLSIAQSARFDDMVIARRLVGLLPVHGNTDKPDRARATASDKNYRYALLLLTVGALAAAIFFGSL
jgi:hypothetical protein